MSDLMLRSSATFQQHLGGRFRAESIMLKLSISMFGIAVEARWISYITGIEERYGSLFLFRQLT